MILNLPKITQPSPLEKKDGFPLISEGKQPPLTHPCIVFFSQPPLSPLQTNSRLRRRKAANACQMPHWLLDEYINATDILHSPIPAFTLGYITPPALFLYKHATLNANSDATLNFFPSFCFWISNIQHDTGLPFGSDSRYSEFFNICGGRRVREGYGENKFVSTHSQIWFLCSLFFLN